MTDSRPINLTHDEAPRRRWDPVVRVTHWGIMLAVIANAMVLREGSPQHVWVGYALAGLLGLRLIWGIIGSRPARFSSFPPNPMAAIRHVRDIVTGTHRSHPSHNPLGALMVYAIWATLLAVVASGIALANPSTTGSLLLPRQPQAMAPAAERGEEEGEEGEEGEEVFEEVHEFAVNLLYVLIALHLAGVVFETRRSGRQIVTAMTTG